MDTWQRMRMDTLTITLHLVLTVQQRRIVIGGTESVPRNQWMAPHRLGATVVVDLFPAGFGNAVP